MSCLCSRCDEWFVEVDETTEYRMDIEHSGGTGLGKLYVYEATHQMVSTLDEHLSSSNNPEDSLTFEFEADPRT